MQDYTKYKKFIAFCSAQRKFEGGGGGKNNPANLRCRADNPSSWNHLAIGQTNNFCNFLNEEVGIVAHENQIYSICTGNSATYNAKGKSLFGVLDSGDLTIGQMIAIFAPVSDGNDSVHYALTVCMWSNLPVDTKMKDLLINDILVSPLPVSQTVSEPLVSPPPPITYSVWNKFADAILAFFG